MHWCLHSLVLPLRLSAINSVCRDGPALMSVNYIFGGDPN